MKKTDDYHEFNPGKYISMLYRHGRCYMDTAMSKFEIGSGQYTFLFYLYKNKVIGVIRVHVNGQEAV